MQVRVFVFEVVGAYIDGKGQHKYISGSAHLYFAVSFKPCTFLWIVTVKEPDSNLFSRVTQKIQVQSEHKLSADDAHLIHNH